VLVREKEKSNRVDYRIQVDPSLQAKADKLFRAVGQPRGEAVGRVLEWLMNPTGNKKLNDTIQRQILKVLTPGLEVDIARIQLERMAKAEPAEEGASVGEQTKKLLGRSDRRTKTRQKKSSTRKQAGGEC